jgi:hypothetical protein
MNGTFENALVKVAYKCTESGQIGFKFRGKFTLESPILITKNNEFEMYFSTESGVNQDGRVLINGNISRAGFLKENKFLALLNFFKLSSEIVNKEVKGSKVMIENEPHFVHKRSKTFGLCESVDLIQEALHLQAVERAEQAERELQARIEKVAAAVIEAANENITLRDDNRKIDFEIDGWNDWEHWEYLEGWTAAEINAYYLRKVENRRVTNLVDQIEMKVIIENPKLNRYMGFPSFSLDVAARVMNFLSYKGSVTKKTKKIIFDSLKNEGYKIKFSEQ